MGRNSYYLIMQIIDRSSCYTSEISRQIWDGCYGGFVFESPQHYRAIAYASSSQGNSSVLSTAGAETKNERRELAMISALIDHPKDGLILYELGAGKDYPAIWGAPLNDIFARVNYVRDPSSKILRIVGFRCCL